MFAQGARLARDCRAFDIAARAVVSSCSVLRAVRGGAAAARRQLGCAAAARRLLDGCSAAARRLCVLLLRRL
jgi:hypothetical protein